MVNYSKGLEIFEQLVKESKRDIGARNCMKRLREIVESYDHTDSERYPEAYNNKLEFFLRDQGFIYIGDLEDDCVICPDPLMMLGDTYTATEKGIEFYNNYLKPNLFDRVKSYIFE